MAYQATKKQRKEKIHKVLLREKEQEIEACEQSRLALAKAIKSVVAKFLMEEGQEDKDAVVKVGRLSWIGTDLRKHLEDLKV